MKKQNLKINKESRAYKYYIANKKLGKSKKESALIAGYSPSIANATALIEKTNEYQVIENHFKDELASKLALSEIADALVDNIKQEGATQIDRGARNKAIEIALSRLEPEKQADEESVIVIVK